MHKATAATQFTHVVAKDTSSLLYELCYFPDHIDDSTISALHARAKDARQSKQRGPSKSFSGQQTFDTDQCICIAIISQDMSVQLENRQGIDATP